MSKFERVKYYYLNGFWTKSQVQDAVKMGWITQEEYNAIVKDND